MALINANRRAVVQVWYADLGGTNIGHAVHVQARRARPGSPSGYEFLINDPMKRVEEWVTDDKLKRAMERWGSMTNTSLRFLYSPALPYVAAGAS